MGVDFDNSRSKRKRKGLKRKSKLVSSGSSGRIRLPKNYYQVVNPPRSSRPSTAKMMSSYGRVVDNPGSNMSVSQSIVLPYAGDSAVIMPPYRVPKLKFPKSKRDELRHDRYIEQERQLYFAQHPELNPDEPPPNINLILGGIASDLSRQRPYSEPFFTHLDSRTGEVISVRPSEIRPDSREALLYVNHDPFAAKYLLSDYKKSKPKKVVSPVNVVQESRDGIPQDLFDHPEEYADFDGNFVDDDSEDEVSTLNFIPVEEKEVKDNVPVIDEKQMNVINAEAASFNNVVNLIRTQKNENSNGSKKPRDPRTSVFNIRTHERVKPVKPATNPITNYFVPEKRIVQVINGKKVLTPLHVQFPEFYNSILTPMTDEGKKFINDKVADYKARFKIAPTHKVMKGFFNDYKMRTKVTDEEIDRQVKLIRSQPVNSSSKAEHDFFEQTKRNEYHSYDAPILANFYVRNAIDRIKEKNPEIQFNDIAIRKAEDLERKRYATAISRTNASRQKSVQAMDNFINSRKLTSGVNPSKKTPLLSELDIKSLVVTKPGDDNTVYFHKSSLNDAVNRLPGNVGSLSVRKPQRYGGAKSSARRVNNGDVIAKKEDITLPMNQQSASDIANAQAILEMEAKMHSGNVKDVDLYW